MTDKESIRQLFHSFEGKRLLIIGDAMVDAYLWGRVDRISPEAPVPVVSVIKRENRLGGAANVALNVRNLGGVPLLCSVCGADEKGKLFLRIMRKEKLDTGGMLSLPERITTVKFRIIGNKTQMLRVDEESDQALGPVGMKAVLERIHTILDTQPVDAILFEDYDKGVISPLLIKKVVERARELKIPVVVDPKKKHFKAYRDVNLFKPNLKELRDGLKLDSKLQDMHELEQAVQLIQAQINATTVLATLSERGIFYSHRLETGVYDTGLLPGHARDIVDVSGAGDTVISLAALCVAAGAPIRLTAAICNLGGSQVCESPGVVPVDKDKLLEEALRHFGS